MCSMSCRMAWGKGGVGCFFLPGGRRAQVASTLMRQPSAGSWRLCPAASQSKLSKICTMLHRSPSACNPMLTLRCVAAAWQALTRKGFNTRTFMLAPKKTRPCALPAPNSLPQSEHVRNMHFPPTASPAQKILRVRCRPSLIMGGRPLSAGSVILCCGAARTFEPVQPFAFMPP